MGQFMGLSRCPSISPSSNLLESSVTRAIFPRQLRYAVTLNNRRILGVLVVGKVSGGPEKIKFAYMWSIHLRISLFGKFGGNEPLQFLPDDGTFGFP